MEKTSNKLHGIFLRVWDRFSGFSKDEFTSYNHALVERFCLYIVLVVLAICLFDPQFLGAYLLLLIGFVIYFYRHNKIFALTVFSIGFVVSLLYLNPQPLAFLGKIGLYIGIPMFLALIIANFSKSSRGRSGLVCLVILAVLAFDLDNYFSQCTELFKEQAIPPIVDRYRRARPLHFPKIRRSHPDTVLTNGNTPIRYLPLISQEAYAFSPKQNPQKGVDRQGNLSTIAIKHWKLPRNPWFIIYSFWNPLILLKEYSHLVNSALPPHTILEIFGVDQPIIQFRKDKPVNGLYLKSNDKLLKFSYKVLEFSPNLLELNVNSNESGLLYWIDGYDSNWKARINGEHAVIQKVNYNFKGVTLPQGRSHIRFEYEFPFLIFSLKLFFITFVLGSIVGIVCLVLESLGGMRLLNWRLFPENAGCVEGSNKA